MPRGNPYFETLETAKHAYDDNVDIMRAKYGHEYTDEQLTAEEIARQAFVKTDYLKQVDLFTGYYQG